MVTMAYQKDIGYNVSVVEALSIADLTTASNATAQNGISLDRLAVGNYPNVFLSCKVSVLVGGATVRKATPQSYSWKLQTSPTSTAWTDFADHAAVTNHTITVGSTLSSLGTQTAQHGVGNASFNLASAPEWIRVVVTPTIGIATGSSAKARIGATVAYGGGRNLPSF